MIKSGPIKRLQVMLDDYVESFGAVGVLVAFDVPGQPRVHVLSGGRTLGEDPLKADALYPIGSQTKTFVAIALLQLCNEQVVALDDPVIQHLGLPLDPRITLRHLIMNTSGLPEFLGLTPGFTQDAITPARLVSEAVAKGQMFTPGEHFDYSNTGWVIAALALDAKAPGGYAGYVRDRIFQPLGMTDSYVSKGYPRARLATGYLKGPGDERLRAAEAAFSMSWAYGAGDIVSTCDDLLNAYQALSQTRNAIGVNLADLTAEVAFPGPHPAHPATVGAQYGYGLERRSWGGAPVWGHPGRVPAFGSATWIAPDTSVIVTTAYSYVEDATEAAAISAQRYNPPLLFTQALTTAHAMADAAASVTSSRLGVPDAEASRGDSSTG